MEKCNVSFFTLEKLYALKRTKLKTNQDTCHRSHFNGVCVCVFLCCAVALPFPFFHLLFMFALGSEKKETRNKNGKEPMMKLNYPHLFTLAIAL